MKALDVKFFLAPQGFSRAPKAQAPRGVGSGVIPPRKFLKQISLEHSETPFPAFFRV